MLTRTITPLLRGRLRAFPAVVMVGPRQCGKTTLARSLGGHYFDLEQPSERLRLDLAWPSLAAQRELVVLDEAQTWPEVFPRLRGTIDADRARKGRFLLLGSVSPLLMRDVAESLAGRLAVVELTPLLLGEVGESNADRLWRCGGFPDGGVLDTGAFPVWQDSYLQLMAQRDLPTWGLPAKPALTQRLLRMLAALNGALLNFTKLGQSLGISYHTVQSYLEVVEGAYLVRSLPPLEANLKKRLVKSPRLYFRDSGLLHALLGLRDGDELAVQPWVGASWEAWAIEQIISTRRARGDVFDAFFFRSHDGLEVDLVLESGRERELIEVKLTTAPGPADWAALDRAGALLGATRRVLLSRLPESQLGDRRWSVDLATYLRHA